MCVIPHLIMCGTGLQYTFFPDLSLLQIQVNMRWQYHWHRSEFTAFGLPQSKGMSYSIGHRFVVHINGRENVLSLPCSRPHGGS